MVDESAVLAVVLMELSGATPDSRLSEGQRIDAVLACRDAFSLCLTTQEVDAALTPTDIAGVVARAARGQFE